MPLAAPIGTNKGLVTRDLLEIIIEQSQLPVVVDAGLGAPSHAAEAMEMGADAVLVNTAIAVSGDPVMMAQAFAEAVHAELYMDAYNNIDAPTDEAYYLCPICGYIHKGDDFEKCPICFTPADKFRKF